MLPGIDGYQVCREIRAAVQGSHHHALRQGERSLTRCWGWSWGRTTISSNPLIPKSWSPGSRPCCAAIRPAPSLAEDTGREQIRRISGSDHQSDQLLCYLSREHRWTCRPRSWSFYIFWLPHPTRCLPANSCWTISGAYEYIGEYPHGRRPYQAAAGKSMQGSTRMLGDLYRTGASATKFEVQSMEEPRKGLLIKTDRVPCRYPLFSPDR